MKRIISFMIFLLLLNPSGLVAHAKAVGTFSKVEGRVDVTSPGAQARPVSRGDEVGVGDIVRVKSTSKAEIVFIDGGILRIAERSRVKIDQYIMEKDRKSALFNLFRGKIENVVKKSGGLFGFGEENKQEVHTPNAVCGVRGTDFFSTYQKGISNFVFKEGQGYGYNKNRPDQIMDIHTGQAMVVINPDVPAIVRAVTANEIGQHVTDTLIKKEDGKNGNKKEDKKFENGRGEREPGHKRYDKGNPRDHGPGAYGPGGPRPQGPPPPGGYPPGTPPPPGYYGSWGPPPPGGEYNPDAPPPPGGYPPGTPPPPGYYGSWGPPPPGGEYNPDAPPPPGGYVPGTPPPPGYYGSWGPPPPGGEYNPDAPPPPGGYAPGTPPPPGEYGAWVPPPPGEYGQWVPPPPGEYALWAPPPPGEYWGVPGSFYPGDFGPDNYWLDPSFQEWDKPLDGFFMEGPDIFFDISDFIPGFRVDAITLSGNSATSRYDLTMSGIYNWNPPFIYMYEDIRGELAGSLKQGYFYGFTGCAWNTYEQRVDGVASFFYIATDTTGGLIIGDVSGYYYPEPSTWNASGSLYAVELGSGIPVPGSVDGITDYPRDTFFVSGHGDFFDSAHADVGDLNIVQSFGIFDSIAETQHWGYWRTEVKGAYTGNPGTFDHWFCQFEQKGLVNPLDPGTENLRLYLSTVGAASPYIYGEFEGNTTGGWVDIEHAVTGIAVGEFHGGYDPSGISSDFFAATGGVWIETGILMTKLGTPAGRDDLAKLKIPNIQIGKATIAGNFNDGGGNQIDVTMTDVTFLSSTTGGTPRIWATDSVTGTYTGTPSTAWTVALTQTAGTDAAGVAAEFNLRTWDAGSKTWAATINNGTGTVGGQSISFKGGAGGNIDSPAAGQISGTAAGWAK